MAKLTYVCGNCGARFTTEGTPKGCPVCWSENTVVVRRKLSESENLKRHMEICESTAQEMAVLYSQIRKLAKERQNSYAYLFRKLKEGRIDHVPSYRDYM